MKSFKYLIILVIFLKTGNVLSENTLFNVNNVEISGNLSSNNQSFSKRALEKGFKELINKVLLQKGGKGEILAFFDVIFRIYSILLKNHQLYATIIHLRRQICRRIVLELF